METDKTTVVDAESDVDGKLKGRDARVLGRFRGEIELSGRLATGEGSKVDARLQADAAEIAGEFSGEIRVRALLLTEKARVQGTVHAELISMREGAVLQASVNSGPVPRPATPRPAVLAVPPAPVKGIPAT
jgi:cytoskeletal protein CcmA (bactofilin family)